MSLTDTFSPHLLRFAIEIELQSTNDVKAAAITALAKLKKDPEYYINKYGFVKPVQKARPTKYIKRIPKPGGGWKYIYAEPKKIKKKKNKFDQDNDDMAKAKDTSKLVKKTIINKLGKQQTVYVRLEEKKKKAGLTKCPEFLALKPGQKL